MNALLWTAAGLLLAVGIAHSVLGERYILMRLFRRADLPRLLGSDVFTKRTLRFAWHLTSVAWWGFAAQLAILAARSPGAPAAPFLVVIAVTFLVHAVTTAVASRGRHLAWPVFLAVAVCAWLAAGAVG